jgi:phenylalanyl-tRNA synthetase beta chain
MKISRNWLQTFFDSSLPDAQALSDALTFHAFEIEDFYQGKTLVENDDVLDVKVTANRGHDCLSHRGIAKEISAILNIPLTHDPLAEKPNLSKKTDNVSVAILSPDLCGRYIAGYIRGVKVKPTSDSKILEFLESIGQKSINNIVDATNFAMFNLGQPLHAFDAGKLKEKDGRYSISVRTAGKGEKITTLDGKECALSESMLVIADGNTDKVIGVAGVKGGKGAEVSETTTDIILESANFDGASVRKTAQSLKLRTDASQRFEQGISPELAAYGMCAVADLILKLAGGELVGFVDEYPASQEKRQVSVSVSQVNNILGTKLNDKNIEDAFTRLGLAYKYREASPRGIFQVEVPFERLDLEIAEDLAEEVARIEGYDKIPSTELPVFKEEPSVNNGFAQTEKIREDLAGKGYSEVITSTFAEKGERVVANKADGVRPFLRSNLAGGLAEALQKNIHNKDLLGLKEVKLFEIGTIWSSGKEQSMVCTAVESKQDGKITEGILEPITINQYEKCSLPGDIRYQPFSKYPFIVRDIALWTSVGTKPEEVLAVISGVAGDLVVRSELFDTFEKAGRISYAFRLVLQSFEKTLTDEEANAVMENVYKTVKKEGWEVR